MGASADQEGDHLEERKLSGVRGLSLIDGSQQLNDNMRMANDDTILQLLRSGKVVGLGVDKVTADQVLDVHSDSELGVGGHNTTVGREDKLGRRHVVGRGDSTDGSRVT